MSVYGVRFVKKRKSAYVQSGLLMCASNSALGVRVWQTYPSIQCTGDR